MKLNKRILVADDEPDVRTLIRTVLKEEGFDVVEAVDGLKAINIIKKGNIDLIVLDIMMPKMDGLMAAHEIRALSGIPIIVCTAREDAMTIDMAKKLYKVEAYLTKPFRNKDLIKVVNKALKIT